MVQFGLHFYLAVIGTTISLVIYGSLLSKYVEIQRNRAAGQHRLLPQLLNLMTMLWGILFGLPLMTHGTLFTLLMYSIQAMLLIQFIVKLIRFSGIERRRRSKMFSYFVLFEIAATVIVPIFLLKIRAYSKRHFLGGLLSMALTIVSNFSAYRDMKLAWSTETAEHLSVFWILATLVNAICWSVFGLIPLNRLTLLPNLLGIVVAVTQLITYVLYRNSNASREFDSTCRGDSSSSEEFVHNRLHHPKERTLEGGGALSRRIRRRGTRDHRSSGVIIS